MLVAVPCEVSSTHREEQLGSLAQGLGRQHCQLPAATFRLQTEQTSSLRNATVYRQEQAEAHEMVDSSSPERTTGS